MAWWLSILINVAVKLGVPWLLKIFPNVPAWVVTEVEALIAHLTQVKQMQAANHVAKLAETKAKIAEGLK